MAENKTSNSLPNSGHLPGAICKQFVRRGDKQWGPYWYRFWREDGRLRKSYVRPGDLEGALASIQARRSSKLARAASLKRTAQRLSSIQSEVSDAMRYIEMLEEALEAANLADKLATQGLTRAEAQRLAKFVRTHGGAV